MQELPESLGSLKRLKVLALDQNRIAAVPPAIFKGCTSLHTLTLHENPITIEVPSSSVCQDTPSAISSDTYAAFRVTANSIVCQEKSVSSEA